MAALGMISPAIVAQQAAKIHMHADSGYAADGLLFEPPGTGPFAALLVIPDEWGLTNNVTVQATQFAKAGFVVVAIDLYRGEVAADDNRAAQLAAGLSPGSALHDLKAAIIFLAAQPNVRRGAIGVIGQSAGAAFALSLAAEEQRVAAVVINSCQPPTNLPSMQAHTTVLGNFGGCHSSVSPAAVKNFEKELTAAGVAVSTKIYGANRVYAANRNLRTLDRPALMANEASDADADTLKFLSSALGACAGDHAAGFYACRGDSSRRLRRLISRRSSQLVHCQCRT